MFEFEGLDPIYKLKDDDTAHILEPQDPDPGQNYVVVHALFYTIGLGITVLLMNVLIGVLGANYERFEDQSVGFFFRARVNMLVELQLRPLRRLAQRPDFRFRGRGPRFATGPRASLDYGQFGAKPPLGLKELRHFSSETNMASYE